MKINSNAPLTLTMLVAILFALSCSVGEVSTGGGGATIASAESPILNSVTVTPSTAPRGSSIMFHIRFNFTAPRGNLNGGTLNYLREGALRSIQLPDSLAGQSGGNSPVLFTTDLLSPTAGRVLFQFYLTDNAGNRSNYYSFYLTQT